MTKILSTTTKFLTTVNVKELRKFLGIPDGVEYFIVQPIRPCSKGAYVNIDGPEIDIVYEIVKK